MPGDIENFCKNSFSGGKSRKNGIPVFFAKKPPGITEFHELTPELLNILEGLILHSCDV